MNEQLRKAKTIEKKNKQRWLAVEPKLTDESGIYILTRQDENGFKYAYIGQAKKILSRLAQHLVGFQHIDLSLKKHGLYSEENPHGWHVAFKVYEESKLDKAEQVFIKAYANAGFQLRNKTSGSQGEGKTKIDEYKPAKGYYDGIRQGKITLARELSHIAEKHLEIALKADKRNNKISQKALQKFMELLDENTHK